MALTPGNPGMLAGKWQWDTKGAVKGRDRGASKVDSDGKNGTKGFYQMPPGGGGHPGVIPGKEFRNAKTGIR